MMRQKSLGIFIVGLLILLNVNNISCSLEKTAEDLNSKVTNMMESGHKVKDAKDAIQSVMNLLFDLKGANIEEQKQSDAKQKEDESHLNALIKDLSKVVDSNEKMFQDSQDNLREIESKIKETNETLAWIKSRMESNNNKLDSLATQRCESNSLFIDTLRENQEALEVLQWLEEEIKTQKGSFLEEGKLKSYTEKLSQYSKIYEQAALTSFVKLADKEVSKKATEQATEDPADELSLDERVYQVVFKLIEKLRDSTENLEKTEIQSSRDFATFKRRILNENNMLIKDEDKKNVLLEKLKIDEEVAQNNLEKAEDNLNKSKDLLQKNVEELKTKKNFYENEKSRRDDENDVIDEVIQIYKEQIATAEDFLKSRINDHMKDDKFDETSVKEKRTDDFLSQTGKIREIVQKEADSNLGSEQE